jgi:hypothetical protein
MAEQTSRKREYREAQSAFDRLRVEEKAVFLIEATLSTVARGIEEVGHVLADELDTLFDEARTSRANDAAADETEPDASSTEASSADEATENPSATDEDDAGA